MCGVAFYDHRTARGQRSDRVAARDGKRQREIACTKDRDGADRALHLLEFRARDGSAVRLRRIDAYTQPVPGAKLVGK